jgi:hypothetical protein
MDFDFANELASTVNPPRPSADSGGPEVGVKVSETFRQIRPLLVVVPIAAYYGLRAAGVGDLAALLAGGGVAVAYALVSHLIERRGRALPIFVCVMFALTGSLAFMTREPRVVLLKASIVSTGFGLYLVALSANRSFLYRAIAPLIARGSDERAVRWKWAWDSQPTLRSRMRFACGLAGVLLLAEAAARTAIVFRFTIGQSLFLSHAPAVLLMVALGLIVRFLVAPAVVRAMADKEDDHRGGV